ncbi:hypothetical protein LCGC14_0944160, partial [marine sediment metagenome]
VVNVASGSGLFGSTEPLPYITSKFAVVGLSEALFSRLKNLGINVSVIVPTIINTAIWNTSTIKISPKLLKDFGKKKIDKVYDELREGLSKLGMSSDRAVRKYIRGIKKNQLYIFDNKSLLDILSLKGRDLQEYENFLVEYQGTNAKNMMEIFHKHGINIEDYN